MIERRLARLEQIISRSEPEPAMDISFEALTSDEQIELYLLLERQDEHQRHWNPGRALTPEEEMRRDALLSRGDGAPRNADSAPVGGVRRETASCRLETDWPPAGLRTTGRFSGRASLPRPEKRPPARSLPASRPALSRQSGKCLVSAGRSVRARCLRTRTHYPQRGRGLRYGARALAAGPVPQVSAHFPLPASIGFAGGDRDVRICRLRRCCQL